MARYCTGLAPCVFRCFKGFERCADFMTGAAGPVFVFLCWVLILAGGFMFAEVIYPNSRSFIPQPFHFLLFFPSLTIAINLYSHYHLVCSVSPGRPDDGMGRGSPSREGWWIWAKRTRGASGSSRDLEGRVAAEERRAEAGGPLLVGEDTGERMAQEEGGRDTDEPRERRRKERRCRKDGGPKPERAHHCRVCKTCILKYDHHCPWINSCVGLRNERHFVLFMAYLVAGCTFFVAFGWPLFLPSLDLSHDWPYYTPRIAFTLEAVLATALGIAVAIMASWHILQVAWGETSVEGHDNDYYRSLAKQRGGPDFENGYDLGWERNLQQFFNLGRDEYSWWTLVIPYRIETRSDGRVWEKRRGVRAMDEADELTDEEEGGVWT